MSRSPMTSPSPEDFENHVALSEAKQPAPVPQLERQLVPVDAIKWLMGEGPDEHGKWFGDSATDRTVQGAFWWRSRFRAMLAAAPKAVEETPPVGLSLKEQRSSPTPSPVGTLVERLNAHKTFGQGGALVPDPDCQEAAATLEAQAREMAELRERAATDIAGLARLLAETGEKLIAAESRLSSLRNEVVEWPSEEDIARTISLSYGENPDDFAPLGKMCTADNQPVPNWKVYEEQAIAILSSLSTPMVDERGSDTGAGKPQSHAPQEPVAQWMPIESAPPFMDRPCRQFIRLEGSREHSGMRWNRVWCGEAYIRKEGSEGEMFGYRAEDILRLCRDGDMDPQTARVTHWTPATFPKVFAAADHSLTGQK